MLFEEEIIYKKNIDNTARFALGEIKDNPIICFGVNPSTATDLVFDRTINKIRSFAKIYGFDSWLMLNLYAQRATNPDDLHEQINEDLHTTHLEIIKNILLQYDNLTIIAAWGNLITKRKYLNQCLKDIVAILPNNVEWKSIGEVSKVGHPKHPLYLSYTTPLLDFDVNNYLEKI